jgi:hypothetical protein
VQAAKYVGSYGASGGCDLTLGECKTDKETDERSEKVLYTRARRPVR